MSPRSDEGGVHEPPRTGGPAGALRIVRLANFVAPASGGLRTALRELGKGFKEAGHEPVLIVPGERHTDRETGQGRVITLPGPLLPGTGGYRVLTDKRRVAALLAELAPTVWRSPTVRRCGGPASGRGAPASPP
ncbi:hypothetical protein SAVCW2_08500 [Streptomyces avermitilis]|uniref:Glycosyltransferase subfamily 4-like N-terminal domain-containing protein n=1 Tax=Streptomyces avermitilis TaxID=33903 RepID=A0A4D4MMT6_STRAX|nr:hypothetical protein SAV31267_020020 [Streptomyces avermitilis]GDY81651.1 hypothetical protein SAVCW2_08500 [Streptomyces avermitilis]